MASSVRALRGATTIESDTAEEIDDAVPELLGEMLERNSIGIDDIISVILTATSDIHAKFPAASARLFGLDNVPLLCAQELDIEGATPRCIRILMHINTGLSATELEPVYLHNAVGLRDDLGR